MSDHYWEKKCLHNVYAIWQQIRKRKRKSQFELFQCGAARMIDGTRYLLSFSRPLILGDGGQDGGRLLAAHHGDSGVGPHVQEARAVRRRQGNRRIRRNSRPRIRYGRFNSRVIIRRQRHHSVIYESVGPEKHHFIRNTKSSKRDTHTRTVCIYRHS